MPAYVSGQQKRYNRKKGRWEKVKKEQAFDYDSIDQKAWGLLISFFRFYPDVFLDIIRDENAPFGLELPQRLMLRIQARYAVTYITGARGITKTYVEFLSKETDGVLYPGEHTRYFAPNQKQAAALASQTFATTEACYPTLTSMWRKNNDRADMFKMTTDYGSEFTMYAPRGDNFHSLIGEEMAQEGEQGFDFQKFEDEVKKGHRLTLNVNGEKDRTRVQLKQNYISNAASRQNPAFAVYRKMALKAMTQGDKYDGFCMDMSWKSALLSNIRDIAYYKKEKETSSRETWRREMDAIYSGTGDNPMISDEVLARSRKLMTMETEHCGDDDAIYIVAHDVSYAEGKNNALCADVVLKLTQFSSVAKRDKYKKQVVYVTAYPPPDSAYKQAAVLKNLWRRYCKDGAQATYLLVDAQAYGTEIIEELMKPTHDGTPPLRCLSWQNFKRSLEQPRALEVIYAMKAGSRGATDADGEMIQYAQVEFEQGNVELLTSDVLDGVDAYKAKHRIKDDSGDGRIAQPYKKTDELCQQIENLEVVASGLSVKEKRKAKNIQRDIWSALKYALRLAQRLEDALKEDKYTPQSSWRDTIEAFKTNGLSKNYNTQTQMNARKALLALRRR